jgi:hypothetical protein
MSTAAARTTFHQLAIVAGPGVAVLVAWLLTLPDGDDGAGVTLANVALMMAVVTVGFAVVDWAAGVTTSVVAALSLNYFHTEPYRTLRITDRRDVYSVVLLGALGLAVSAVTAARVRRGVTTLRQAEARDAGVALGALLADDRLARDVWVAAIDAAANDLALVTARVTPRTPAGLPIIGRRMADADDPTLLLPAAGAVLPLQQRHAEGRWLIVTPRPGMAPLSVDRRAVLSFADAVELALEPSPVPAAG